jgi:hypothetical protein
MVYPKLFQHSFNFGSHNDYLLSVSVCLNHTQLPNFWPQLGHEYVVLFCIMNLSSLKEFIQPFIVLLHPFFGSCLMASNLIWMSPTSILPYFLHYPSAQLCLINKGRIQVLEPLLRSTFQIQLGNLSTFRYLTFVTIVNHLHLHDLVLRTIRPCPKDWSL